VRLPGLSTTRHVSRNTIDILFATIPTSHRYPTRTPATMENVKEFAEYAMRAWATEDRWLTPRSMPAEFLKEGTQFMNRCTSTSDCYPHPCDTADTLQSRTRTSSSGSRKPSESAS
jgi:hypothetical protein